MRQGLAAFMRRRLLVLRGLGASVASTSLGGLGGLGASLGGGALGGGGHGRGALVARGLLVRVTAKDVPVVLFGSAPLHAGDTHVFRLRHGVEDERRRRRGMHTPTEHTSIATCIAQPRT